MEPPLNGNQYNKNEVMDILTVSYNLQWSIIKHMITSNPVPCGKDTIYEKCCCPAYTEKKDVYVHAYNPYFVSID